MCTRVRQLWAHKHATLVASHVFSSICSTREPVQHQLHPQGHIWVRLPSCLTTATIGLLSSPQRQGAKHAPPNAQQNEEDARWQTPTPRCSRHLRKRFPNKHRVDASRATPEESRDLLVKRDNYAETCRRFICSPADYFIKHIHHLISLRPRCDRLPRRSSGLMK